MKHNACAATFRIYHQQRVKHMSMFFGKEMYPLYIRVTHGTKSLNFKSHCFDQLLQAKYQNYVQLGNKAPELAEVSQLETALIEFLIGKHQEGFSLPLFKKEYDFYTHDLLDKLDEEFKQYLVEFFFKEDMPSIAYLLENLRSKLTADMILDDLKRSLSKPIYDKIIQACLYTAPPYIPLLEFCKLHHPYGLRMLLAYHFYQDDFQPALNAFIHAAYPGYNLNHPYLYVSNFLKELEMESKL